MLTPEWKVPVRPAGIYRGKEEEEMILWFGRSFIIYFWFGESTGEWRVIGMENGV
jgi:hypothetical protein